MMQKLTVHGFDQIVTSANPLYVVWDIETAPLPREELAAFLSEKDIKYPNDPGEFDPDSVKYGNTKDPAKREQKLATARTKHERQRCEFKRLSSAAKEAALDSLYETAALHAHLNRVVAIGYGVLRADGSILTCLDIDPDDEESIVRRCVEMFKRVIQVNGQWFTYNGHGFDCPQIIRKAWKYDIPCPCLRTKYNKYIPASVDLAQEYQLGTYRGVKLDHVAKFFGVGQKLAGITGDMFHKLLADGEHETAAEYLTLDIDCTYRIAQKMKALDGPIRTLKGREKYDDCIKAYSYTPKPPHDNALHSSWSLSPSQLFS